VSSPLPALCRRLQLVCTAAVLPSSRPCSCLDWCDAVSWSASWCLGRWPIRLASAIRTPSIHAAPKHCVPCEQVLIEHNSALPRCCFLTSRCGIRPRAVVSLRFLLFLSFFLSTFFRSLSLRTHSLEEAPTPSPPSMPPAARPASRSLASLVLFNDLVVQYPYGFFLTHNRSPSMQLFFMPFDRPSFLFP